MSAAAHATALAAAAALALAAAMPARAADSAVILVYPRIANGPVNSTVTAAQFDAHIKELQSGPYKIMKLGDIVDALKQGRALPQRVVALTFDSGDRALQRTVWPKLKAANMPMAVFIGADRPGNRTDHLGWEQLSEMASGGVEIGITGPSGISLAAMPVERVKTELARAIKKMQQELGRAPRFLAYPQGEFTASTIAAVAEAGIEAAFGEHSGAAHKSLGMLTLPRFLLSQTYGDMDRFRIVAGALALPIKDLVPADPRVTRPNPPTLGFTVDPPLGGLDQLNCFAAGQGRATVEVLGEARVEVRLLGELPAGRARVNCTMPGPEGRWRWLGIPFLVQ